MRAFLCLAMLVGATPVASFIYAASYAGIVSTLLLESWNGTYELSVIAENRGCGISPSWLMLNHEHNVILCLNEGVGNSNGSLTSFRMNSNGSLTSLDVVQTLVGPVMSTMYTVPSIANHSFIPVAH